ncbi:MAG: preprotein translocase subunit SecA [Patescibacteria group bacterium]|nr:preprotein translocase subunit SecA [Patescibacteria group bacterium]
MSILNKVFGYANKKVLSSLEAKVFEVNSFETSLQKLTDKELKGKTEEFKSKISVAKGDLEKEEKIKSEILPEAFAVMREAMKRVWGERHFDVQLMGGIVLHQGKIAEMKTGEGKTIVAALSLYLNALSGRGVHLVTVNDYLASHQGEGMGQVYDFLGLTTGIIQNNQESHRFVKEKDYEHYSECDGSNLKPCSRTEAYACDITYGTNNEFGFDYLRDNMAPALEYCVQRSLHYAIVDEVDSILIDEARTPLIISAPAEESASLYQQFAGLIPKLKANDDYIVDEKDKVATLTDDGLGKMEQMLGIKNIYEVGGVSMAHHLEQALKAHTLFKKDKDYIVRDGEIVIVDEFTGRLMIGRRYSEGLHQAIEAKEGVEVKQESQTMATISFQNLFRLYKKLAGMTGTAATEAEEFYKIYKLDVVEIPTNKSVVRQDNPDRIYKTEEGKFKAIVEEVKSRQEKGQPVLVGTVSVSKNELLAKLLKRAGIKHEVLNAKNHEREAKIIIKAGQRGAVTVATNMAGRGTDIKLGEGVVELGGLHVLGTERHESRRIDNQLRGRAGRQGDPGSSQFYVSMDDDLMRIFGGERMKNLMNSLGLPEDMPIENKMISRSIESAQRRVEGQNFDIRKHLVEYDDVMNKHREVIYRKRRKILEGSLVEDERQSRGDEILESYEEPTEPLTIKDEVLGIIDEEIESIVNQNPPAGGDESEKAKAELAVFLGEDNVTSLDVSDLKKSARKLYKDRENRFTSPVMRNVERAVYLRTIDMLWVEHLTTMDELRTGIGLRGYGQRDPLVEYKQEAYGLFQSLLRNVESSVARTIFKVEVQMPAVTTVRRKPLEYKAPDPDRVGDSEVTNNKLQDTNKSQITNLKSQINSNSQTSNNKNNTDVTTTIRQKGKSVYEKMGEYQSGPKSQVKTGNKVGRNDPCPCGSGKKYKKCCGK